ncbi:MFS transporter [Paenibacillus glucanolyticus]|uniref:MFS transporter n=1 Tax=Paenibacillus glucanolyticus TaxID=59843 RepID=UPI00128B2ABB|nr:hypothetical protein [Paenibacillus glucanolyticus]MPY19908.1 hypothetical protein [Paenibacillus glucanolyticus]
MLSKILWCDTKCHFKHTILMHCFYGVGVSVSPYLMSLAFPEQNDWRGGYHTVFVIQGVIALITLLSLPIWKKTNQNKLGEEENETAKTVSIAYLFRLSSARATWLTFFGSCAIEYTADIWGSTFLVDAKGLNAESATESLTVYSVGRR